jgi:hypothetical protein
VFGTHGGLSKIEIASIQADGTLTNLKAVSIGMTSALLHVDWATDGNSVVVNS